MISRLGITFKSSEKNKGMRNRWKEYGDTLSLLGRVMVTWGFIIQFPLLCVCLKFPFIRKLQTPQPSNTWRYQSSRIRRATSLWLRLWRKGLPSLHRKWPCSWHHQQSRAEHFLNSLLTLSPNATALPTAVFSAAALTSHHEVSTCKAQPCMQEGRCLSIHISPHFIWRWFSTNKWELRFNDKKAV